MKIESFYKVEGLIKRRVELVSQYRIVSSDGSWSPNILGRYHDELRNAARPGLLQHLKAEVAEVNNQLQDLGVKVPSLGETLAPPRPPGPPGPPAPQAWNGN